MSDEQRQITIAGESIEYQLTCSEKATKARIEVGIEGTKVIVPVSVDVDPDELLAEKADWVIKKRRKYKSYREQVPDRTFQPGEKFPYLGTDRRLIVEPRRKSIVADETLRLRQSAVTQSSVERALRNFYRRQAREYMTSRLAHFASKMGVTYDRLQIRNQRTRWGSCSTSGTISLNCRLLMAPPEIIDYVVIHELAHCREPNHSESFWSLVAEYDPDYEKHKVWLANNASRLVFSEADL